MMMRKHTFTLMEVILALSVTAILFSGMAMAFHRSLRLRETSFERNTEAIGKRVVESEFRRALSQVVIPDGTLAKPFVGEKQEDGDLRRDSLELAVMSYALSDQSIGDIYKLSFTVEQNEETESYELIRSITRNLLAFAEEDPEEEVIAENIESLEITYYDGEEWVDSWDSTIKENALPEAVKVVVDYSADDDDEAELARQELIYPLVLSKPDSEQGGGK